MPLNSIRIISGVSVLLALSACASWEDTRRDVVEPFNRLVHFDYPAALKTRNSTRVAALFAPELRPWAEQDSRELTGPFMSIDRARCVIHNASAPDSSGAVRSECVLRLDGTSLSEPFTWEQERVITARPIDGEWRITSVEVGRTVEVARETTFTDQTEERGLHALNHSRGMPDRSGVKRTYLGGSGVAVGDIDNDDLEDLLLVSGDRLRLFHNTDGTFSDESGHRGIATPEMGECRCAYFADIDNDGDKDLFVGMLDHKNLLLLNDGNGQFEPVPESVSGLTSTGHTSSACFGDFDSDGDLDLFVVNGQNMYVTDPEPVIAAKNGNADQFFLNNGDGTFVESTAGSGLGDTGWGLACATSDFDRDGDLDLFVANDVGPDILYRNRGDGSFEDVSESAGIVFRGSSMSADFGDVNGDGWPDLYVSGMASNSRWVLNQPGFPLPVNFLIKLLFAGRVRELMWEMFHGNRLYSNRGDGTFDEVSEATHSYWLGWAWSSVFLDYDNDSHLDIYGVNGFWTGEDAEDC